MKNLKSFLAGVLSTVLVFGLIGTASATVGKVTRELEYRNIKVSLDGKILDLKNAKGQAVEPFMFDGTNYLPVRALAEALGLQVSWDGAHATVVLTTPGTAAQTNTSTRYIQEEEAKRIAFNHAGVQQSNVADVHVELGSENGKAAYEVEFRVGTKEYDYDIDAVTGAILSFDYDTEHLAPAASAQTGTGNYIGEAKAKSAALAHAGLKESDVTRMKVEFDNEHGRAEYDVEFHVGLREYNYDIDALTGAVLSYEIDNDD